MNCSFKYYTGVGSRKTPPEIMELMSIIGYAMASLGVIGRSGSAEGADAAFEAGYNLFKQEFPESAVGFEAYIPWDKFNNYRADGIHLLPNTFGNYVHAINIIEQIHPRYNTLSRGAKALHTRNVYQVLGKDLSTPSDVLICWAEPRSVSSVHGGTNTAYQLARQHNADIYNLYHDADLDKLLALLNINL